MPRFSANISTMFTEFPFEERFEYAASMGFEAVEYLFPYEYESSVLRSLLSDNGLSQVLFNMRPGNWAAGERGIAAIPGREAEFEESIHEALGYATALECPRVHVMAGIVPQGVSFAAAEETYRANVKKAAAVFASEGLTVCIEPINHYSMPGYFLSTLAQAAGYIEELGVPNLKLQFDFFHAQMQEGCVAMKFRKYFDIIDHCQLAGVPDRHEPDTGELNYPYLYDLVDSLGYKGHIGCEYNPAAGTIEGLGWLVKATDR